MAIFPKIDSPCPYKDDLASIMDGDRCTMCKRDVHELSFMSDNERTDFLASCSGEICVSYSVPIKRAIAAAALTSAGIMASTGAAAQDDLYCYEVIVGGVKNISTAEMVSVDEDVSIPELPVFYTDEADIDGSLKSFATLDVDALNRGPQDEPVAKEASARALKPLIYKPAMFREEDPAPKG